MWWTLNGRLLSLADFIAQYCELNHTQVASARDLRGTVSILGLGRSPGGRHGNPLPYSCLDNPTVREAWGATIHRVAKSQT